MKRGPWLCLAGAGAVLPFADGVNSVPLAAWVAPVLLLRFTRMLPGRIGVPTVLASLGIAFGFQFRGMFPVSGLAYMLFLTLFGVIAAFPYSIDRLLSPRLPDGPSTLIFPLAWAATELLSAHGPTASWGGVAYSQYGNLPLLQLLSVTGMPGIAFLIGWTAAVGNLVWDRGMRDPIARRLVVGWGCVAFAVLVGGGARLTVSPPQTASVRVAAIAGGATDDTMWGIIERLQRHEATGSDTAAIRTWSSATSNDLLQRSEREAQAGARIIGWSEASTVVLKEDEEALFDRGRALATGYGIYLAMGILTWDGEAPRPAENKVVMITPGGDIAWEFRKARPVPGPEAALSAQGDGKLQFVDTPHGRVSAVICFDADFPELLAQAGALDVDILLLPSNDWKAITPWHAQMASYRGIEQGFQLLRPTSNGLSVAYDHQGRRLGATNSFHAQDRTLVVQIPTGGVRTWYARTGNAFGWLSIALLVPIALLALRRAPDSGARSRRNGVSTPARA